MLYGVVMPPENKPNVMATVMPASRITTCPGTATRIIAKYVMGPWEDCINAAITGKWQGEWR